MEKILISADVAVALQESIDKWKECVEGERISMGSSNCSLCLLEPGGDCSYCPIAKDGHDDCEGTPYYSYDIALNAVWCANPKLDAFDEYNEEAAAKVIPEAVREYEYLLELKDRCEIVE